MGVTIMTDTNCDIDYRKLDQMDIQLLYMPYYIDGKEYVHDMGRGNRTKEFFDAMRAGKETATSLLTPLQYIESFEPQLMVGNDIVFICMSSALSSTFSNAHIARKELLAKYPQRTLAIIDSKGMSVGMAQATEMALHLRDKGAEIEEIVPSIERQILHQNYILTVENLAYLRRSGRLTGAAAFFGSMLDIKPLIRFDAIGRLVPSEKVKGRKSSLRTMAKRIAQEIVAPEGQIIRIAQADAQQDAQYLADCVQEAVPSIGGVEIGFLGPVIAAHVGPGAIGILWTGKERPPVA